jgi:Flp pilus assembly protein TadD
MTTPSDTLALAIQHFRENRLPEAEQACRQVLLSKPAHVVALYLLGAVLAQRGDKQGGMEYIEQALRLKADYAEARYTLGVLYYEQGRLQEAIATFQTVLGQAPHRAEVHNSLGRALLDQIRIQEAAICFRDAIRLDPRFAAAHNNLGMTLFDQDRLEEAVACYREAIRLKPDLVEAHNNLGVTLSEHQYFAEAMTAYREALRLAPGNAEAHLNLANQLLLTGDFAEGWHEYEWRWQTEQKKKDFKGFAQPLWQGEALANGRILLHAEQGLGDTIQFIRYAKLVKQRIGTVICQCQPSLARIFRACAGIDEVAPMGEPLSAFDVQAPLMSLPRILQTTLETVPGEVPYLFADAKLAEHWAHQLVPSGPLRVGIVWQGNPRTWDRNLQRADQRRSMPLRYFEPLARVPGVQLFSLQKGAGAEQIAQVADRFPIIDLGSQFNDFSDTAAAMKNLDLVISSCTSPAHLAGALGVPIWMPLGFSACWRWLLDRDDSPWYPTMRLFRQKSHGDWTGVFARMAEALLDLTRLGAGQRLVHPT